VPQQSRDLEGYTLPQTALARCVLV
jgi:hypothetical protein